MAYTKEGLPVNIHDALKRAEYKNGRIPLYINSSQVFPRSHKVSPHFYFASEKTVTNHTPRKTGYNEHILHSATKEAFALRDTLKLILYDGFYEFKIDKIEIEKAIKINGNSRRPDIELELTTISGPKQLTIKAYIEIAYKHKVDKLKYNDFKGDDKPFLFEIPVDAVGKFYNIFDELKLGKRSLEDTQNYLKHTIKKKSLERYIKVDILNRPISV